VCVWSMRQTVGGDNDYVKLPTRRHRRAVTVAALPASEPLLSIASAADVTPPPQLPAAEATPTVPIVYESLRQDATGGIHQEEYLLPHIRQDPELVDLADDPQPLDLTELLADQQMNAAALSSGAPATVQSESESVGVANSQQFGVVRTPCRPPPCDVYYVDGGLNNAAPSTSPAQSSLLYTNMSGRHLEESLPTCATSEQPDSSADAAVVGTAEAASAAAGTTVTGTSVILRPPPASSSSAAGPSPCGGSKPFTCRLPSYEESMSSDAAVVSLSPAADEATTEASPSASALPGYECPPSYVSDQLLELNANTPLKSRQVQQLHDEMSNDAGTRVQLDKSQCAEALALIDCYDRVW